MLIQLDPMAPRRDLRAIIKQKEEEAKLRSANLDPAMFAPADKGVKPGTEGTFSTEEALGIQRGQVAEPVVGVQPSPPPENQGRRRSRDAEGPSGPSMPDKRQRTEGPTEAEQPPVEKGKAAEAGGSSTAKAWAPVLTAFGGPITEADSLEETPELAFPLMRALALPKDMEALARSRTDNAVAVFYHIAKVCFVTLS